MRIAYLHGLESTVSVERLNAMKPYASDIYAPSINYKGNLKTIFDKIFKEVEKFKPDLMIGSSMGALFSYHIGNKLNVKSIIFNPPLYGTSVDIKFKSNLSNTKTIYIYQGKDDKVVDPEKTKKWLEENHKGKFKIYSFDGEHRIPLEVFELALKRKHLQEHMSFSSFMNSKKL